MRENEIAFEEPDESDQVNQLKRESKERER
jgi:hypothetical protein